MKLQKIFHQRFFSVFVLLALLFSALGVAPVLAQAGQVIS